MDLADFHTLVSSEINKGTLFDDVIPDYTRRSARWLERNYDFKHMERFVSFTVDSSATEPRAVSLPERCKSIEWLRIVNSDGSYTYLTQVDGSDVTGDDETTPTGYWLDGVEYFWFDNTPQEDLNMEMCYLQFTDWPTDTSQTPWFVANAEDVLLGQTIIMMAPRMREPKLKAIYQEMRDEGLRTITLSDEGMRASNRSESMVYKG